MKPIPATYEGLQHFPGLPSFALWTIHQELPGHPKGSTVSDVTIRNLGYCPFDVSDEEREALHAP